MVLSVPLPHSLASFILRPLSPIPAMSQLPADSPSSANASPTEQAIASNSPDQPQPTYVKLAMRNMVKKRGTSLKHFALTTLGLLTLLVGLAYITR